MKLIDYFQISFLNITRNNKKIYILLIFILCTILLISALCFSQNYLNYINKALVDNIGFRTIMVTPKLDVKDYGLSELNQLPNIVDIYSSKYDFISLESSYQNENSDGIIELNYGNSKVLPPNIIGTEFKGDDVGVAICPIQFYPSSDLYQFNIDNKNVLSGYDLLDTFFEVKYYSYLSNEIGLKKNQEFKK